MSAEIQSFKFKSFKSTVKPFWLLSWLSQDHRQPVSPFEKKGNAFSIWTGFHSSVLNSSEILEWQFEREIVAIDYKHKKARPKIDRAQKDEF
ncbi:MAG: hypothetical protein ACJAWA_000403, partial [Nonlabens sp.]